MIQPNAHVLGNVTQFLKLTALREDPSQTKWVRDEFDLLDAIDMLEIAYQDTQRMVGKPMYVGDNGFDFTEDVKRAMEEILLDSRDSKDKLLQRKTNITMYHLVLEPIIDQFAPIDHELALADVKEYLEQVRRAIITDPTDPNMDDAIVSREMIRQHIRDRDASRKQQKLLRRTKRRRTKLETFINSPDEDVDDD